MTYEGEFRTSCSHCHGTSSGWIKAWPKTDDIERVPGSGMTINYTIYIDGDDPQLAIQAFKFFVLSLKQDGTP